MSNQAMQVGVLTDEQKRNQEEALRLEAELDADRAIQTEKRQRLAALKKQGQGVTVKLVTKERKKGERAGEEYTALTVHGIAGVPMFFFPEDAQRLLGDSEESVQIRQNILQFIEQNKAKLTWKK